jgi:hypothetical protein
MLAFAGPKPNGLETRHLDGDHSNNALANLAYGTHAENMQDALRHGTNAKASRTHCAHGHEYTEESTGRTPQGQRVCRVCDRLRHRRQRAAS